MYSPSHNGSLLNKAVLVLNTNYAPLMICTARRAICLTYLEKVEILVTYNDKVHSPSKTLALPSIIKLRDFVHYNSMNVVMNRKNIMIRDKHTCQYCGKKSSSMTIDHIIPKERGGSDYWDNLVAACQQCNKTKDNHTPEEA
ncbi:MAG TPA: HNH endonuclease, partial [Candidatus Marinimicrobia bacterium]|nr:HNH endonuclease [Candidatus Neomarinimicrobiota bacterium]